MLQASRVMSPGSGLPGLQENWHAALVLREDLLQDKGVDAGDRDIGAEAIDDQGAEREPDAVLQFGRLGERTKIDRLGELFGGGGHLNLTFPFHGPIPAPGRTPQRPETAAPAIL